ncbi:MAG: hypothetical protein H6Q89_5247 [Myxococcaceae bacterium]|nr:hypothetical protein [Myxococcaceae bacterium]
MKPSDEQLALWGASMREIDPASLIPDEDGARVRWFLGDNGTELFAWSHGEAGPHHLQLVFARVSVEWSTQRGLITGTFKTGSTSSGGRYDPYLLSVGQQIDPEVCASARKLLERSVVDAKVTAPLVQALAHASGG